MRIKLLILPVLFVSKLYGQQTDFMYNEKWFKASVYLEICLDNLKNGLFKSISDINFDSTFTDSIKIVPLKKKRFQ